MNHRLWILQEKYVERVLQRFGMERCKSVGTPLASHFKLSKEDALKTEEERQDMAQIPYASAVGSLMYAMVCIRQDIAHVVGLVSRYMADPGKKHWEALKWILPYLKGTISCCLCYSGEDTRTNGHPDRPKIPGVMTTRGKDRPRTVRSLHPGIH